MKKLILLILALYSMLTANAFEVGNLAYSTSGANTVTCTGLSSSGTSSNPTSITIPGYVYYNGTTYRVSVIRSQAFQSNKTIQFVSIDAGVDNIGSNAFNNCTALKEVRISGTVKRLYDNSFYNCTALKTIYWNTETVPILGSNVFYGVSGVTLYLPSSTAVNNFKTNQAQIAAAAVSYIKSPTGAYDYRVSSNYGYMYYIATSTYDSGYGTRGNLTLVGAQSSATQIILNSVSVSGSVEGSSSTSLLYDVGKIADYAFQGNTTLTGVTIYDGAHCKKIGDYAFLACTSLKSISIYCDTVGIAAFNGCSAMTSMDLYAPLEVIQANAFNGCSSLTGTLYLPTTLKSFSNAMVAQAKFDYYSIRTDGAATSPYKTQSGVLYNSAMTTLQAVPQMRNPSDDYWIPQTVRTIYSYAFLNNKAVKNVVIPSGVTTIYNAVFQGCTTLERVSIPSTVTTLYTSNLFNGCSSLGILNLNLSTPPSLSSNSMTDVPTDLIVFVPAKKEEDYTNADIWKNYIIDNGGSGDVFDINGYFRYNILNTEAHTGTDGTSYTGGKFEVSGLMASGGTTVIPSSKTYYGSSYQISELKDSLAAGNIVLKNLTIGSACEYIGIRAFYNCTKLESASINALTIGNFAFENCTALSSVSFGSHVNVITYKAFVGCSSLPATINLPENLTQLYEYVFSDTPVANFVISSDNSNFSTLNGVLYNKDKTELVRVPEKNTALEGWWQDKKIPASVKTIRNGAFDLNSTLTKVYLPLGVETIGATAFARCTALKQVNVPSTVTTIGASAFYGCNNLTNLWFNITLPMPQYFVNYTPNLQIHVPAQAYDEGYFSGNGWEECTSRITKGSFDLNDGVRYYTAYDLANKKLRLEYSGLQTSTSLSIPSSVSYYGNNYIPDVVGYQAFKSTDLQIVQGASIKKIMNEGFRSCSDLSYVNFPDIEEVGILAFMNCKTLEEVTGKPRIVNEYGFYDCEKLVNFDMSELEYAYNRAFQGSSVNTGNKLLLLPKIKEIGDYAFNRTLMDQIQLPYDFDYTKLGNFAFGGNEVFKVLIVNNKRLSFFRDVVKSWNTTTTTSFDYGKDYSDQVLSYFYPETEYGTFATKIDVILPSEISFYMVKENYPSTTLKTEPVKSTDNIPIGIKGSDYKQALFYHATPDQIGKYYLLQNSDVSHNFTDTENLLISKGPDDVINPSLSASSGDVYLFITPEMHEKYPTLYPEIYVFQYVGKVGSVLSNANVTDDQCWLVTPNTYNEALLHLDIMNTFDLNNDGKVSTADIQVIINEMKKPQASQDMKYDLNGDEKISTADIQVIINEMKK